PGLATLTFVAEFRRDACPPNGERVVIGDVLSSYHELCSAGSAPSLHGIRHWRLFVGHHRRLECGYAARGLVYRKLVVALDFLAERSRDAAHDGLHLFRDPKPAAASSWSKADCELGGISLRQFGTEPALWCAGTGCAPRLAQFRCLCRHD